MLMQTNKGEFSLLTPITENYGVLKDWTLSDLVARAEQYGRDGAPKLSAALYKNWIASNPDSAWLHAAYFNFSVALAKSGDRLGAINATRECLRLKPDFLPPYINLGRLMEDAGQAGDAVAYWKTLVERLKDVNGETIRNKLVALEQLGRVLESHNIDGPRKTRFDNRWTFRSGSRRSSNIGSLCANASANGPQWLVGTRLRPKP